MFSTIMTMTSSGLPWQEVLSWIEPLVHPPGPGHCLLQVQRVVRTRAGEQVGEEGGQGGGGGRESPA